MLKYFPEISIQSTFSLRTLFEPTHFPYMVIVSCLLLTLPFGDRFPFFCSLSYSRSPCHLIVQKMWTNEGDMVEYGLSTSCPLIRLSPHTHFISLSSLEFGLKISKCHVYSCMFFLRIFKSRLTSHCESPRGLRFTHTVLCDAGEGSLIGRRRLLHPQHVLLFIKPDIIPVTHTDGKLTFYTYPRIFH